MKRQFALVSLLIVMILASCVTSDHGVYKGESFANKDRVMLVIDKTVSVFLFDQDQVIWSPGFGDTHRVVVPPGNHQLGVVYYRYESNGYTRSNMITIQCTFDPGKTYYLYSNIRLNRVEFKYVEYQSIPY